MNRRLGYPFWLVFSRWALTHGSVGMLAWAAVFAFVMDRAMGTPRQFR